MSVQRNQYIIIGCEYDYDEFNENYNDDEKYVEPYDDNAFDEKIIEHNGLSMIYDGMNGQYVYIGKIIEKTKDYEVIERFCFDDYADEEEKDLINAIIKTEFPKLPDKPINVYLVTHYR